MSFPLHTNRCTTRLRFRELLQMTTEEFDVVFDIVGFLITKQNTRTPEVEGVG